MKNTFIKVLVAGTIAGIVATGVKTVWEMGFPARANSTDSPPLVLADRAKQEIGEGSLTDEQKPPLETTLHWTFGVTVCLIYSLLAEKYPSARLGYGLLFGVALYAVTHGSVLPALDTEPWFFENKPEYALSEFGSHLAFGAAAEITRRFISGKLD